MTLSKNIIQTFFLFLIIILGSENLFPQRIDDEIGLPSLKNFNPKEYKAHGQNFDIVHDKRGLIYVANFSGVLEYDGNEWRLIATKNNSKVTALSVDNSGIIFVGARDEIGFLEVDSTYSLVFRSLNNIIEDNNQTQFEIIKILSNNKSIFFVAEKVLFEYVDNKVKTYNLKESIVSAFIINGELVLNIKDEGLRVFNGKQLDKLQGADALLPSLEFPEVVQLNDKSFLFASSNQGLYVYKEGDFENVRTEADDYLYKNRISSIKRLNDGKLVIGTSRGGIVLLNSDYSLRQILNEKSGLQNESVKSLHVDADENLWVALNNGISVLEIASPLSFFDEKSGLRGGVTGINRVNGQLYVSTYQGLYKFNLSANTFDKIVEIDNACWALIKANNSLLVATSSGLYEVNDTKVNRLYSDFFISASHSRFNHNRFFASTLKSVMVFEKQSGSWKLVQNLNQIKEEITNIVEASENILLLETISNGFIKYNLSDNSFIRIDTSLGLNSNSGNKIFVYNNAPIISTESNVYKFNIENNKIEKVKLFGNEGANNWYSLFYQSVDKIWLTSGDGTNLCYVQPAKNNQFNKIPFLPIEDVVIRTIYLDDNNIAWFGGPEGLIRFDNNNSFNYQIDFSTSVRKLILNEDELIFGGGSVDSKTLFKFSHNTNSVRITYSSGSFNTRSSNHYKIFLKGLDEVWSGWTKSSQKEYTNLPEGEYTFLVKAKNIYGHESSITEFSFVISTPWYKTIWAYIFYLLSSFALVIGLVKLRSRQLEKEKEELQKIVEQRTSEIIKQKEEIEEKSNELSDKNEELEKINVIVKSINSEINFSNLLNSILEKITVIKGIDKASALVYDKNSDSYKFKASFGWSFDALSNNSFSLEQAEEKYLKFNQEVFEDLFLSDNYRPRQSDCELDKLEVPKSILVLLVKVEKKVEGFLILENLHRNEAFKLKDISFLKNIKEHIISAFIKTKILEDLQVTLNNLKDAQTQLIQAEKLASLGQLTAGIAHEIKNPLNFVNNFAELSKDLVLEVEEELDRIGDSIDPKSKDYILEVLSDLKTNNQKINEHGKRADSIIRGMLLHSRGKSGEKQKTDLNALLLEYVNLGFHGMRAQDSSFNIKIESDYDQTIGQISVVPQDLSRVFLNMVNNSCYSTHEKKKRLKDAYSPVLSVSTKNLGSTVEVKIRDNGEGIPQHIVDKIFNPFFTTKPTGAGTGLGLSLSYDIIVQQHNGEVKVFTEQGEFAEFVITLPKN